MKGACVCKGRPLGRAQAGSQTQLFVTGLPCYHGSAGGGGRGGKGAREEEKTSQQIAGREEGKERRLCAPRWQDQLFLAKNYF